MKEEIKPFFSDESANTQNQINDVCEQLASKMKAQAWIGPNGENLEAYGILGFNSAEQAIKDIRDSLDTVKSLKSAEGDDPELVRTVLLDVKSNITDEINALKKSLSERDRDIPTICDKMQEAIFSFIESVELPGRTAVIQPVDPNNANQMG